VNSDVRLYTRCRLRAEAVAKAAGAALVKGQGHKLQIDLKGKIDLVTNMDRRSERFIGRELTRSFPDFDFMAEEAERNVDTGSEFRWVVDPIDGTTNYAHGLPIYSVSIALEHRGRVVVGVVYQPVLRELFSAQIGCGARQNGRRIAISGQTRLEKSLLVTGFPYDIHASRQDNLKYFGRFAKRARAIRRLGSAALDLCYVACGRFDGFWELKLSPWDVAAASLIATEAGAHLSTMTGDRFSIFSGSVVAASRPLHGAMLKVIGLRG